MSAPDSGSRAMPCPPPTIHDQSSMRVDLMPAPAEPVARRLGDARLRVDQAVAVDAHARRLDGLLHVQPELEHVQQHLRLRLEDAVGARRADD